MKAFFLLLLLTSTANAAAPDTPEWRAATARMMKAHETAHQNLPPCAGLDHFSEATFSYEPPLSCPKARELFEFSRGIDLRLRENCRELGSYLEGELRDPYFCEDAPAGEKSRIAKAGERMQELRKAARPYSDNLEHPGLRKLNPILEKDPEFERSECATALEIQKAFYSGQHTLASNHYTVAEEGLSRACGSDKAKMNTYLDYLHHGQDAVKREDR